MPATTRARITGWFLVAVQFTLFLALIVSPWDPHGALLIAIGSLVALGGLALAGAAFVRLGDALTPTPVPRTNIALRTSGVYRWVRHPIYSAILVMAVGANVAAGTAWTIGVSILLLMFFTLKLRWEDSLLRARFGQEWSDWASHTGALIPRLGTGSQSRRIRRATVRLLAVLALVGSFLAGWSFQGTAAASNGEPTQVLVATWLRDLRLEWLVAQMENVYFQTVGAPQVGGTPTVAATFSDDEADNGATPVAPAQAPTPAASSSATPSATAAAAPSATPTPLASPVGVTRLTPPADLISPVETPEPGEGQWQGVGTRVEGLPAIYVTRVRGDDIHTAYYATAMWVDTSVATTMFIPGYEEPDGGPNPFNGALPEELHSDLLANINGGFRLRDTLGGYYYDGTMVKPLVDGKASAVVYRDGTMKVVKWGRDAELTDDVLVVRQNLDLIVDKGKSKVSNAEDNIVWGATTDKGSVTWRAAVGERPDGSLVYVIGESLTAQGLADTLVSAGVERAMTLDMNQFWAAGFYFKEKKNGTLSCTPLVASISPPCDRFLRPFKRDSFHFLIGNQSSP